MIYQQQGKITWRNLSMSIMSSQSSFLLRSIDLFMRSFNAISPMISFLALLSFLFSLSLEESLTKKNNFTDFGGSHERRGEDDPMYPQAWHLHSTTEYQHGIFIFSSIQQRSIQLHYFFLPP
jgi:hypothetical protein